MSEPNMHRSSDDWNKLKHLVDLSAENARLKAEVERLTNCKSEADRLKAEVERLRASSFVTAVPVEQYERVIKAGDAMADAAYAHCMCQDCEEIRDQWRDAKRGDQP